MGKRPINVLLIGDDPAYAEMMERSTTEVTDFHFTFEKALSIDKGLKRLSKDGIDVILLDLSIKENMGLETLGEIHDTAKDLPIVVISNTDDEIIVKKALKKGANDYLPKEGLAPDLLARSLSCAFFQNQIEGTLKKAREDSKILVDDQTEEVRKIYEQMIVELVERKRVEQELRESEDKYRILVENANDGIVIIQDGLVKYINQRFFMISGYKAEELIDTSFIDYIHPDETEKVLDRYKRRTEGEDVVSTYESAIRHKDGHKVDVEFNVSIFSFKESPAIIAIVRDITARKKSEEKLKAAQDNLIQKADDLNKRVNELNCLYGIYKLVGYKDIPLEEILQGIVNIIPPSWQYPEITCARISLDGKEFKTINFKETKWNQAGDINVKGERIGCLEVFYLEEKPEMNEGPFLNEERSLMDALCEQLGIIIESRYSENAVRESEEKWRNLFENSIEAAFTVDIRGNFTSINDAFTSIMGYEREEILGSNYKKYANPEIREYVFNAYIHLYKTGEPIRDLVYEIIRKDGEVRTVEGYVNVVRKGDEITGFQGTLKDITDRKQTEEALHESEERYRNLVENLNDVIFNIDMKGNFTYMSPAIERISKYSAEEFIGKSFAIFTYPEDIPMLKEVFMRNVKDMERSYEFRVIDKDGKPRHVRTSARAQLKGGKPVGMTGIMTDITEQKQAEESLRESEEKFRSLFETSKDVVYLSSIDGRFLEINTAGEELFGYTRDELLSIDIRDLYTNPDNRARFQNRIEKEGFVKDFEITFKRENGTIIDSLITAAVRRDSEGNIIGYQGIIRDITGWKKMEAQLIRTEKLSSLGEIVSGVAHELNNPMTSIIGNAQLLIRKDISTDIKDKIKAIERESIRCSKIVRGLLTFAKEHKPERRLVNLNNIINTSLNLMEYELRVNNISFDLNLSSDIPETSADPYQLQQVFINLIKNAQDAMRENGGNRLAIGSFYKNDNITIEFEDNGPGIPKENLRKIFDPFFTTKEVGEGTGLGLSIVFGIINEHGGRIDVDSEVGKGTKFRIELPVTTEVIRDEYIKTSKPKRPDRVVSILVIDDEEPLRNYISEVLSLEGYVIKTCGRGEEAIELLQTNEYNAIISDIKMPGMSGQDIYTSISKNNPELAKKILFITGDVLGKNTQSFLKTTKCKFVEKPFYIDVLLSRLNEMLSA